MRPYFIGVVAAVMILAPVVLFAQSPGWSYGIKSGGCLKLSDLGLSEDQRENLRMIESRYLNRVTLQRNKMMIKRIELQNLIRDPDAQENAIRLKAGELQAVQGELRKTMIDYQIDIRGILTSDQLQRWCTLLGEPGHWMGR